MGAYVDDVLASIPPEVSAKLWNDVQKQYKTTDPAQTRDFTGIRLKYFENAEYKDTYLDMTDYSKSIVQRYQNDFNTVVTPANTPATVDIRGLPPGPPTEPKTLKVLQSIMGAFLWLVRCTRPDIFFEVVLLCGSMKTWTEECSRQLHRLVSYLSATLTYAVRMRRMKASNHDDFELLCWSDSDWSLSRSYSGVFPLVICKNGSFVSVVWSAKGQSVTADSAVIAELFASHAGAKQSLPILSILFGDKAILRMKGDNAGNVQISARGSSKPCAAYEHAVGVKIGFMHDLQSRNIAKYEKCAGIENVADILTKVIKSPAAFATARS